MTDGLSSPATGSATRPTATGGSNIKYDSPFLDMTSFYMPTTIKELFRFINSVVYSDPIASQSISKLSEYPITDIMYNDGTPSIDQSKIEKQWKNIIENIMKADTALKTCGMDYYSYGTSLASINYPFKRMLRCGCGKVQSVEAYKTKIKNGKFHTKCISCGNTGEKKHYDLPTKEISKFGYVFWDLANIEIKYNNMSGEHFFYYTIPDNIRKAVKGGDMDIVNGVRSEVIEAVMKNKKLKLSPNNLFHYKRPGPQLLSPDQRGWGIPAVMPVLKDIFYKRILKKGNEAIAFEHIVPLRIIFPQGAAGTSPHSSTNLGSWKKKVEAELVAWKGDPNRISVMPLPVGHVKFGGDGRLLLTTNEVKAVDDDIIIGIGVIPEIIKGGASWSGSNVSLRVVENTFLDHRKSMKNFLEWTVDGISKYMGLPSIDISLSDFKMADDIQRKKLLLDAASASQISFDTAIKELGLDPDKEYNNMLDEVKKQTEILTLKAESQAEAQGSGMIINSMYSVDAQFEAQQRGEMHQREARTKHDAVERKSTMERSEQVQNEAGNLSRGAGVNPNTVSTPDLILMMTRRFARLAKHDVEDFKIRMLSMKNSMPSMYNEVYSNLKEMNIIEADLTPDIAMAQKHTPGELASYTQGDTTAAKPASPVEEGGSANAVNKMPDPKPLPEAKPPSGPNASI